MRVLTSTGLTLALLTLLAAPPTAAGTSYRWSRGTVCVERHTDHYWGVVNAVAIWNEVGAGPVLVIREDCPYYGTIRISDVWRPGWYGGMTWTTRIGDRLVRAVIKMNNAAPADLPGERARHWRRFATGHEFGHALGLHHSTIVGSIMCYSTDWYANDGTLHWTDRRSIKALYR